VTEASRPAASQLPLSLPHREGMTRADFLVGAANKEAIGMIDDWPEWPASTVLIVGPVGSGKTHLVEIWRERSDAAAVMAQGLRREAVESLIEAGAVAVEDLHIPGFDEDALFHLINVSRERKVPLLLTSRVHAAALHLKLPDLRSRLRAAQPVELGPPDDELLRRVMVKLFADRQLTVDDSVVDYIALRMERSLEGANAIVDDLDREALAAAVPVTRRLAAISLARVFDRQPDLFA
jgi:chromosomal replication initiation ATPase DnaA